jgi:hypothetical protein
VAWTSEGIKEVVWCCLYCRKYLIDNSKKCMKYGDNEIQTGECTWMQRNSQTRTTVSWKNKKITEMDIEEIKKELQDNQRSHVNKSKRKQLEQLCTMYVGVQKQHSAPTREEKWKIINSG